MAKRGEKEEGMEAGRVGEERADDATGFTAGFAAFMGVLSVFC